MLLQSKLQAAFLFTVALIVLTLAVPRLIASLWELRPAAYLDSSSASSALTTQQLLVIKPELVQALNIFETAHNYENLGLVNQRLAQLSDAAEERRSALLLESEQAIRSSLALSCANPYAWLNLALLDRQLGKEPEVIIDALSMSLLTGRAETRLYLERLQLAFEYYPAVAGDIAPLLAQQLRLAWKDKRNEVLQLVLKYKMQTVLSAALSYTPADR